jgi:hypothetical protein
MRLLDLKLNKRRWWRILFDAIVISLYLSRQNLCFDKWVCRKNVGLALMDKKIHTVTVHYYPQKSLLTYRQSLIELSLTTEMPQSLGPSSSSLLKTAG